MYGSVLYEREGERYEWFFSFHCVMMALHFTVSPELKFSQCPVEKRHTGIMVKRWQHCLDNEYTNDDCSDRLEQCVSGWLSLHSVFPDK